jgi:hypothetical protein
MNRCFDFAYPACYDLRIIFHIIARGLIAHFSNMT